jgi:hypothetical protein
MELRGIRNERSYIRSPIAAIGLSISRIHRFIPPMDRSILAIELSIPYIHRSIPPIDESIRRIHRSISPINRSMPAMETSISRIHRSIPPIKRSTRQDGRPIRRKESRSPALVHRSSRAGQSGLTFAPAASKGLHWPEMPGFTYARAPIHAPSQRSLSCNIAYAPKTED